MFIVPSAEYLGVSWGRDGIQTFFFFLDHSFVLRGAHESDQGQVKEKQITVSRLHT